MNKLMDEDEGSPGYFFLYQTFREIDGRKGKIERNFSFSSIKSERVRKLGCTNYVCKKIKRLRLRQYQVSLRQYQVGDTSSRKITEVKQLGPWLALGWVNIQVSKWMLVVKNTVKSQKWRNGGSNKNS